MAKRMNAFGRNACVVERHEREWTSSTSARRFFLHEAKSRGIQFYLCVFKAQEATEVPPCRERTDWSFDQKTSAKLSNGLTSARWTCKSSVKGSYADCAALPVEIRAQSPARSYQSHRSTWAQLNGRPRGIRQREQPINKPSDWLCAMSSAPIHRISSNNTVEWRLWFPPRVVSFLISLSFALFFSASCSLPLSLSLSLSSSRSRSVSLILCMR